MTGVRRELSNENGQKQEGRCPMKPRVLEATVEKNEKVRENKEKNHASKHNQVTSLLLQIWVLAWRRSLDTPLLGKMSPHVT
jgi:hypothetical protein